MAQKIGFLNIGLLKGETKVRYWRENDRTLEIKNTEQYYKRCSIQYSICNIYTEGIHNV